MNKLIKAAITIVASLLLLPGWASAAVDTIYFQPQAVYSGVNATTSSSTAQTLISSDVVGYSSILFTPTVGSITLTLPASSTLSTWLPSPGLWLSMFIFNATSTAGQNIIIAGNTANGSILENASTSATITSYRGARLDVMREPKIPGTSTTTLGDFLWTLNPAI